MRRRTKCDLQLPLEVESFLVVLAASFPSSGTEALFLVLYMKANNQQLAVSYQLVVIQRKGTHLLWNAASSLGSRMFSSGSQLLCLKMSQIYYLYILHAIIFWDA